MVDKNDDESALAEAMTITTPPRVSAWLEEALELRDDGEGYNAIAKAFALKYHPAPTVDRIFAEVSRVMDARKPFSQETIDKVRMMEIGRLDRLTKALMPKAMTGDVPSVKAFLLVMQRRADMLGLDAPKHVHHTHNFDYREMTEEQLTRIARGESPIDVLAEVMVN